MRSIHIMLCAALLCGVSCSKRYREDVVAGNGGAEEAEVEQMRSLYVEEEINWLPREELMRDAGKVFYIVSDVPVSEFCRRAVVFTEDDKGVTAYLTIEGSVIRDRLGAVLIDGTEYGGIFYAWKIERYKETNVGFHIYCYWKGPGHDASTTDPLSMKYDVEKDLIYIWHIDPKDL
jgi:hypothetical protein